MFSLGTSNDPQVCILNIQQGLSFISYKFATMHRPRLEMEAKLRRAQTHPYDRESFLENTQKVVNIGESCSLGLERLNGALLM